MIEIVYADLQREYIEWMEINEHFISIPNIMFTTVIGSLKVKKMQPFIKQCRVRTNRSTLNAVFKQ